MFGFRRTAATLFIALTAMAGGEASFGSRSVTASALAGAVEDPWQLCSTEISRVESEENIPDRLLHAVAQVEAGRYNKQEAATFAWPWTVMAEGRGRFLPSKQAAIAEVRKLQKAGVENIDVGCMQINLRAHPDAFASLGAAFDPATNVAYAARFLKSLRQQTQSWVKAVANYHSTTPQHHVKYRAKVLAAWQIERSRAVETDREGPAPQQADQLAELRYNRTGPVIAADPNLSAGDGA